MNPGVAVDERITCRAVKRGSIDETQGGDVVMTTRYFLSNPGPTARHGFVETPWKDVERASGLRREEVVVVDRHGDAMPSQVDRVLVRNDSRDVLVVAPNHKIPPAQTDNYTSYSDTLFIKQIGTCPVLPRFPDAGKIRERNGGGLLISNNRLEIDLQLMAARKAKKPDSSRWFGGSVRSILLDGKEVLFPFDRGMRMKPSETRMMQEKRVMQVDKVLLWNEDLGAVQIADLYDSDFRVRQKNVGPARVSVSIVSEKSFESAVVVQGRLEFLLCRLSRVLSLYKGADFILDELRVEAETQNGTFIFPPFRARYFSFLRWNWDAEVIQYPHQRDWFGVISRSSNAFTEEGKYYHPGYGVATNRHARVKKPHPYYPGLDGRFHTVSWEMMAADSSPAQTIHQFFWLAPNQAIEEKIGYSWFAHIYKPVKGEVAPFK